jgi:hypothetical protein
MERQTDKLLLLGVLAVATIYVWALGSRMKAPAAAEAALQDGSSGEVMVVPIQLDRDNFGIAMVDTRLQSLWIYELNRRAAAHNRLRLIAARSWEYDKLLEEYNTAEPKPKQVKELLERLSSGGQKRQYEDLIREGVSEKEKPRQVK